MESKDLMQTTRRPAGFTLVELLVVVAILALLIALLMPALGRAKYLAKNTRCTTNLRQTALAAIGYATDNAGRYPTATDATFDDNPLTMIREEYGTYQKDYRAYLRVHGSFRATRRLWGMLVAIDCSCTG